MTPLHYATSYNSEKSLMLLTYEGADVNAKNNINQIRIVFF